MKDIQLYVFDYGGTLDTAGCHWGKMIWHAYEAHQVPVAEQSFRDAYVHGERTLATHPIIGTHFTFHDTLTAKIRLQFDYLTGHDCFLSNDFHVVEKRKAIVEDLYNKVKEETGRSVGVLQELGKAAPLVLVSNFYGNMNVVLEEFGLKDIFKYVIESAVVGVRKPDPKIFQLALDKFDVLPEKVLVVGDSYTKDILPAHSLGCKTAWVKGEGWTDDEIDNSVADVTITNIQELL